MNGQIDSLDHIEAMTGDQNASHNLAEPRYELYPHADNPSSSFGAGGKVSQVIDPEYRAPANQVPAFSTTSPITFADLNQQSTFNDDLRNSMLHQYGPPIPEPPGRSRQPQNINLPSSYSSIVPIQQHNPYQSRAQLSITMPHQQQAQSQAQQHHPQTSVVLKYSTDPQMPTSSSYSHTAVSSNPSSSIGADSNKQNDRNFHIGPYISPTTIADRSNQRAIAATSSTSYDQPLYSPHEIPLPNDNPSPPLDQLSTDTRQTISSSTNGNGNPPKSTSGKIPKKTSSASTTSDGRYDRMDLLGLQAEYRRIENELNATRQERSKIEQALNEISRSSRGKNVELDPNFRQKKDDQKKCDLKMMDIRSRLKQIDEKLKSRFNHKIQPSSVIQQNRMQRQQRAKMSTATPTPKSDTRDAYKDHRAKRLMFDLKDSRSWCQACDFHFDNLKEFCEHLHKRDHNLNVESKPTPWRTAKDQVDRIQTYAQLKSICSKLETELPDQFSMRTYDETLYTSVKDKHDTIKRLKVARERGKFEEDDRMFEIKGYQHLLPITGYYCKLCDRTLCDLVDAEQHLKGYNHAYNHAKSIALDPSSEINFRSKCDKSYQKVAEKEKSEHRQEKQASPVKSRLNVLPSSVSVRRPQEDDESALDKVRTSVPEKSTTKTKSRSKAYISSDESEEEYEPVDKGKSAKKVEPAPKVKPNRKTMPEIVPITRDKPTATLKRLKNGPPQEKSPSPELDLPVQVISDSDGTARNSPELDKVVIPQNIHMDAGDPDSPFPHLEMSVTGHIHLKMLKDPRLKYPCRVKMNRIKMEDYSHMLLESTSLWSRVNQMVAKKEKTGGKKDDFKSTTVTQPLFFDKDDEDIPVDVDGEGKVDAKGPKDGSDMDISDTDGESGLQAEKFDMSFLDNFFCEK